MKRDNMTFEEEVIDRLARIETNQTAVGDHEPRIRKLEDKQSYSYGAVSVLGLVGGALSSFVWGHLKFF